MTTLHRRLLDEAVDRYLPHARSLDGLAIYITGASGFLASSLVAFINQLQESAQLNLKLYASARRPLESVPLFSFLKVSPSVQWTIASAEESPLPQADNLTIVHTASYGSPKDYLREPIATFTANTDAIVRMLGRQHRLKHFVYFSSAEVYGQPTEANIPTTESYQGSLNTLSPRSIYGESKRMGEVLGASLCAKIGIPFTAIRPWNVYGPGQRLDDGRIPIEFIRQGIEQGGIRLASNGSPTRCFCYAWDAITQITAAIASPDGTRAVNIGNGTEEISILDAARACAATCGISPESVSFDPEAPSAGLQRCVPDIAAALAMDGVCSPLTSLQSGLATLLEWHRFISSQ